jgi:hypothetical protein
MGLTSFQRTVAGVALATDPQAGEGNHLPRPHQLPANFL